jgi:hypothetical protein
MNSYYFWELGFYLSGLLTHFTLETRRKDFLEMAIHHVVTIGLILFSHTLKLERLGLLVLFVHDVADIFLESGKLFAGMGQEIISTFLFVCLLISWGITRLYYFPCKIIYSWVAEHQGHVPYFYPFTACLITLQVLHVYWFILICKAALRKITKGNMEDPREVDEKVVNKKK